MAASLYLNNVKKRSIVNGNHKILRCWPAGVEKYTPGSFYNFEEDNKPLYDLEDRTYFNWQKLGFPANEPNSIHLLVSADAPAELINCNSNIFTTLQGAVDSLPRYITVNVRITVASYGNLSGLNMDGISVDPTKSLEIVNINAYDKPGIYLSDIGYTGQGGNAGLGNAYYYDAQVSGIATDNNNEAYGIYTDFSSSCLAEIGNLGTTDPYGTGGFADFLLRPDTIAGGISVGFRPRVENFDIDPYVASSAGGVLGPRVSGNYFGFATPIPGVGQLNSVATEVCRLSAGILSITEPQSATGNNFIPNVLNSVKLNMSIDEESDLGSTITDIYQYDPSSYDMTTGTYLYRTAQKNIYDAGYLGKEESAVKLTVYGNYLELINMSNCTGRINIRNFLCRGSGIFPIGIQIDGCPNVFLESCATTHYGLYGICLTNSKVTFQRSLYVHRCYEKGLDLSVFGINPTAYDGYTEQRGLRLSKPWLENIKNLDAPVNDRSAGIVAFNSQIEFSDREYEDYNFILMPGFLDLDANPNYKPGVNSCKMISRCSTGIRLVNSIMTGGHGTHIANYSSDIALSRRDFIHIEGHANYGIDAKNSLINLKANLEVFHNTRGIRAEDSDILLDSFKIDNNHLYGMHLNNSNFTYGVVAVSSFGLGRFDYQNANIFDTTNTKRNQFLFNRNGQHIIAVNSNIKMGSQEDPKPASIGRFVLANAHATNQSGDPLPGIYLENSVAEFVHLTSLRKGVANAPLLGGHILATNNSKATFLGSASSMTVFTSPTNLSYAEAEGFVGLVAKNNSTLRFRGPTAIYDGAINVLAENNSTMIFEPHKLSDGSLDTFSFPLTDIGNQTKVEVKAIKSCLVADKGSSIIMEDLGDYMNNWSAEDNAISNFITSAGTNNLISDYTRYGFFQFYPNPNADANVYGNARYSGGLTSRGSGYRMTNVGDGRYYWGFNYASPGAEGPYEFSSITNGGLCVKATNNSNVRVRNVNFPCGWWNSSGTIYDLYSAPEVCDHLFIWNFSNNSTLHADHLSVSSAYPSQVGYHGPSALWLSGAGAVAYGAPSGTPDTSSLSVLDAFGYGASNVLPLPNGTLTSYGKTTPQNQGPFRLYVGVDSLANRLMMGSDTTTIGFLPQLFAQGYNASGYLSAVDSTSSLYGKAIRINDVGDIATSGFYYNNEFVKIDPNSIMLDESAANTFANAKNGAMGSSNRAQICTIYHATTDFVGEAKAPNAGYRGSGFRSPNIFDSLEIT